MINMILAADEIGGIGFKNGLPWPKIKEDLNWFRQLTEENVIVMGSTTWKSLGIHAPLKHRHNYVISSTHSKDDFPGCFAVRNPKIDSIEVILKALDFAYPEKDVFIIYGDDKSEVYSEVLVSEGVTFEVPAFKLKEHIVWGATAMMLIEIKSMLNQILKK